jgi:hypothetical protein
LNARNRSLIAMTVIPVALVGGLLWWLAGLVPECSNMPIGQLDSPDASLSMIVFTRDCGAAGLNTQAVIVPAGGNLADNATGFLAIEGEHVVMARWDAYGNLEITLPADAVVVQRQDEAAGISIIYN